MPTPRSVSRSSASACPSPAARSPPTSRASGPATWSTSRARYRRSTASRPTLGHLGGDVELEAGRDAARTCAINVLAALKAELGELSQVRRIVKVTGFVACTPDFTDAPKVVNAASELFGEAFGDAGRHARAAVGVAALPLGVPVEVEAIVEVA